MSLNIVCINSAICASATVLYPTAEPARNQKLREARRQAWEASHFDGAAPPPELDDEPPPF
jgi:hypothetical protein